MQQTDLYSYGRQYIAEFFLEWEICQKKYREKENVFSVIFSRKSCPFSDYVNRCGTARQATDGSIIRRIRIECWITKATDTRTQNM
jgi:hypothetical protein